MINNTLIAYGPVNEITRLKSFLENIQQAASLFSCENRENEFIAEAINVTDDIDPEDVCYEPIVPKRFRGPEDEDFGSFETPGVVWDVAAGKKAVRKLIKKLVAQCEWCDPDAPRGIICADFLRQMLWHVKGNRNKSCLLFAFQSSPYNTCKVPYNALALMFQDLTMFVRLTGDLFQSERSPAWSYEFARGYLQDEYIEGVTEVDDDEDDDETGIEVIDLDD
ncbi:MAG: hypothetical protein ABIJ56_22665 [Pseudomonadota bacterium]